jgi:hypothetical protein
MSTYREAVEQLEAMKLSKRTQEESESSSFSPRERIGVRAYPLPENPRRPLYALPVPEAVQ